MAEGSLSPLVRLLLTYLGWFILPQWATNITVLAYYFCRRLSKPSYQPPRSGSPQALKIRRHSYTLVMAVYFISTTVYAFVTMPENFYQTLGISPNADELAIKAAYKRFARRHHPDHAGPQGEALFIEIRKIYEALNNPVKRLAYDRFGSQAMEWTECVTTREYMKHGLLASSGFYIGTIGFLLIWSIFIAGNLGTYWRNLLLCTLFFTELHLIVNGSTEALSFFQILPVFRQRVPYQHILFLHQFYMSLSMAISRILPVILPSTGHSIHDSTIHTLKPVIDKLAYLAITADKEVTRLLATEIRAMHGAPALPSLTDISVEASSTNQPDSTPFLPSNKIITALTDEMENLLIDGQLQSHPVLRGYWEAAIRRRRQDLRECGSISSLLPSPPKSLSPSQISSVKIGPDIVERTVENGPAVTELPSPRPSPPRQAGLQLGSGTPNYSRGRSLSC